MKKHLLLTSILALGLSITLQLSAQVSISNDNSAADNSAILDVKSSAKGVLLPRMTKAEMIAIINPASGLVVYCTNCGLANSGALSVFMNGSWYDLQTTPTSVSCGLPVTINHVAGTVAPVTKTVVYGTTTGIPGEPSKCWITSNLGADHQATAVNDASEASAGWYWQFNLKQGYKHDGTTRTPNTAWISSISENSDWIAANDPCNLELGNGWRIPTSSEWLNVDASGNWTDWNGPWNSVLKLHASGVLVSDDGSLNVRGSDASFWSSVQNSSSWGYYLTLGSGNTYMTSYLKAFGFGVRCIRN